MKTKEIILNSLHKIVRKDQYINDLLIAPGSHLDLIKEKKEYLKKEFLFSTMSLERIEKLEKELAYKTKNSTLEGKRLELENRWKSNSKCDLELIQMTINTFSNIKAQVKFIDASIAIKFSSLGVPANIKELTVAIKEIKPAHLDLIFYYKYRIWRELKPKKWRDLKKYTWKETIEKEEI